jgi:hypothetical protein
MVGELFGLARETGVRFRTLRCSVGTQKFNVIIEHLAEKNAASASRRVNASSATGTGPCTVTVSKI